MLTVQEDITNYLKTYQRYTAPQQVYETFSFLMKETKEMFITLRLDGKNRIICMDLVSIGSLNQSIVHPREVFKTAYFPMQQLLSWYISIRPKILHPVQKT
jgi:DNA repair protein RadC